MAGSSAIASRRARAVESFGNCQDALGAVGPGYSIFAITRGQWSLIDAILHLFASHPGPVRLSLWTWTLVDYELEVLTKLAAQERIESALLVIDLSARNVNSGVLSEWRARFGSESVKFLRSHAKLCTLEFTDSGLRYLLRTSANLNHNPRFEQFDATEGGADFDLVREIEADVRQLPTDANTHASLVASKLSDRFSRDDVPLFGPVKTWRK